MLYPTWKFNTVERKTNAENEHEIKKRVYIQVYKVTKILDWKELFVKPEESD